MKHIYLVDDEVYLTQLLSTYLLDEGYSVTTFNDSQEASKAINSPVDLWILDIMMPKINGYTLFNKIKEKTPDVPIFFISARNEEFDRVIGLEMGCEDYLSKPFLPRELIIKVNRYFKRQPQNASLKNPCISLGLYNLDTSRRTVLYDNEPISLTNKEFDLLYYFFKNPNTALKRDDIIDAVWGQDYFGSLRVVDDTLRRIKKKAPLLTIENVYGYGYILKES